QVSLASSPMAQVIPFIRDGRLRALAVTPATRSPALPDIPTIAETLPGFAANGWYGICAPRGTPDEVIAKLSAAITASVADPGLHTRLVDLGVEPRPMPPAELGKCVAAQTDTGG